MIQYRTPITVELAPLRCDVITDRSCVVHVIRVYAFIMHVIMTRPIVSRRARRDPGIRPSTSAKSSEVPALVSATPTVAYS